MLVLPLGHTEVALIFESFGILLLGEDPGIIETSLPFPPKNVDPSDSIVSKATVSLLQRACCCTHSVLQSAGVPRSAYMTGFQ